MRGLARQVAVVAAAAFDLVLNGLAGSGLLFGVQTGAVSDEAPTPITPAGWAFSIWSVIFVGVAVFAVWQALPAQRGARYDALAVPFVAANVLNGLWQIPWLTGRFGVAALVIVGILASLVWLYVRLDRMRPEGVERWTLGVPASLFLGWVSVATSLNLTIWLRSLGWTPEGVVWPAAVVLTVAAVGGWLLSRTADLAVAVVLLWSWTAIALNGTAGGALRTTLVAAGLVTLGALAWGARSHSLAWGARSHSLAPTAHARA